MELDVDVVVIGGGPVGATALALLGLAGLSAVCLEKDTQMWPTARAVHFDGETMRTLQALGIAEEFERVTIPMKDVAIINEADEVLVHASTDAIGDQAWHDHISFHQPDVEELIRTRVKGLATVDFRAGDTVTRVENTDSGVIVTSIDQSGNEHVTTARWAIAADGARSEIRSSLGIESDKYGEDEQWLVVDGQLADAPGCEADMVQFGRFSRPALWLRLPGKRVRMEFMLMPGDDPDEIVTPEAVERISRGVLPVGKFVADRQAMYTFRGRISQRWRDGHVFLVGDAAHQAPPLFGQGLCAGIRDVQNLVWKMATVVRGFAQEDLLDTYESERKPHAEFWVKAAAEQAVMIQTTNPEVAAGRDAFMKAHPEASAVPLPPALGPGLHFGDKDERAGKLGPQPVLADGTRLDDMVGTHFLVATTREIFDGVSAEVKRALNEDGETVTLLDPAKVDLILSSQQAAAVVMRPDHYVLGTANSPSELEQLLKLIPSVNYQLNH